MEHTFLEIDTAELERIIAKLDKLADAVKAPDILMGAINTTAKRTRTRLLKEVKKRYAVSDDKVWTDDKQGAPTLIKAKTSDFSAAIRSKGPMLEIMKFMTDPNSGTGAAAAKVLNNSGMKPLEKNGLKAFVTKFSNGHVAIVQRDPPNEYTDSESILKRTQKYHGKADMTKIKKLLSPAVPHMLDNEEVRAKAEGMAYETLQREIQKRIDNLNLG